MFYLCEVPRIIFHIDVNSAFLSWPAVKRVMEGGDDIRLVPSVVSGDPSDRRSIIAAASIPAKKLGIKAAMPVSMALRQYPQLVIVRGDWAWYKQCSESFIAICRNYSPVLQQFSIDECFIDMGLRCSGRDPVDVATRLKEEIKTKCGFTVNVGVGPNKLLAKMASDFEKPDKVHTLWQEEIPQKMWPLGVRDLLWVGKKTEGRLLAYGIGTIGDLARIGVGQLARVVGARAAQQLHDSANGIDDTPVDTEVQEAKSYSAERTFAKDLSATKDIDRALFNVACIVAHRIRRDEFRASTVSVFIKYHDFTIAQKQCQMARPSATTAIILNEARRMVAEIWDGVTPLRQVGLGVSKLTHEPYEQLMLFEDPQMEYYRQWDRLYDEEKSQAEDARMLAFGRKVVQPAEIPPPRPSRRRSELKDNSLVFTYSDGEQALAAAKSAVKQNPTFRFYNKRQEDGTRYFVVVDEDGKAVERHFIEKRTNE
ncbi:MAG: DNA polymerase IV [Bacteroidaceae bacterium]|nr:DNA polymerase IV [Bacteroidaceae bacterium]